MSGTVVNFCGFETGDLIEAVLTGGTFSASTLTPRSGTYCLRTNPTASTGWAKFGGLAADGSKAVLNLATAYVGFWFRFAAGANAIVCTFLSGATVRGTLRLTTASVLKLHDKDGTERAAGATPLAPDTWYHIELLLTVGVIQIFTARVNEAEEATYTDNVFLNAATDYVTLGPTASVTVDFRYDDLIICSTNWPPDASCGLLLANGNGTDIAWAGVYTAVDDRPHDGSMTYIYSVTALQAETATMQDTTTLGAVDSILAVKGIAVAALEGAVP